MNLISVPQKETFCWLLLKTILAVVTWSFECGKKQSTPKRDCSALLCGGSSMLVPVSSVATDPAFEPPYNETRWEQPSPRTRFLLPPLPQSSLAGSVPSLSYCASPQTLELAKLEGKKQQRRGKRESHPWCWDGVVYDTNRHNIYKTKMTDLFCCFIALSQDNREVLRLHLHDILKILYVSYVHRILNLFQQATKPSS